MNDGIVGELSPFPALVAVHRVIAAADCGDAPGADFIELYLKVLEETKPAGGGGGPSISERMNGDPGKSLFCGQANKRDKVPGVAMHASVGNESHQVERRLVGFRAVDGFQEHWILVKLAVSN